MLQPATCGHQHVEGGCATAGRLPLAPGLLPRCQTSEGLLAAATSVKWELSEGKAAAGCAQWLPVTPDDVLDIAMAAHGSQLLSE